MLYEYKLENTELKNKTKITLLYLYSKMYENKCIYFPCCKRLYENKI